MKAMVFHGPYKGGWEEVPDATIQKPTDLLTTTSVGFWIVASGTSSQAFLSGP